MEQIHITLCGLVVPAEVLLHLSLDQSLECFGLVLVQRDAALDSTHEIVGVVALEGEAQAAFAVLIHGRNGILQTTGGVNNGYRAVTHSVHLAQTTGLGLGGHQVHICACVDAGCQIQLEHDLCADLVGEFLLQILEELLVLHFTGTQDQQLAILFPQQLTGDVYQQIQTLVTGKTGNQ